MNIHLDAVVLRKPEPKDVQKLYVFRNDPEVTHLLGGFSSGYSMEDLKEWISFHRTRSDEVLWVIADPEDACVGHVGLYQIDYRVRKAEFAIMIGDKSLWNKGIGGQVTKAVIDFGFRQLNLHRIHLDVLASNPRAIHLYEKMGFRQEGILRDYQFKNGQYIDVIVMSILETEW